MKKRISQLLMAVAMLVTGAASMGCLLLLMEEPNIISVFED